MNWLWLAVVSALLLGFYEAAKKNSVANNAVPAVLMVSMCCGAVVWLVILFFSRMLPEQTPIALHVAPISWRDHALIAGKSAITTLSWMLAYTAMKTLPLSIASPLRSTGPIWTIMFATVVFGERPTLLQCVGLAIILVSLFAFSVVGHREGIDFRRHRGVWLMFLGTLVGAISGLYDKFLLQKILIAPATLQAWFSIDLLFVMLPVFVYWLIKQRKTNPFQWRSSIPAIAILLLLTDFAYFAALSDPDALVSIISPVRRLSAIVALAIGIFHLKETQAWAKFQCVSAMVFGVTLIAVG